MRPLNICLVIDHLRAGGAQGVLFRLARGLVSRGHTVKTVCLGTAEAYETPFTEADLDLDVLGYPRRNFLGCARALRSCVRDYAPHIVQSFLFKSDMLTRISLHGKNGPRLVSSIQWGSGQRVWWQSLAYRLTARWSDFVVVVSDDGRRLAVDRLGAELEKTRVIRNAIDPGQFDGGHDRLALRKMLGIPPDSFMIVSAGRLAPVKSYDVLINAFALIADEVPEAQLVIAGDGPLLDELRAGAAPLGDKVWFPGYRHNAWRFAGAADVFVSTSRSEGSSIALLEAMAQGTPPIATDVAGNNEIVRHGQTGLLVPWNDARALASALTLLYKDSRLGTTLGRAARAWVEENHSADVMAAEYEKVYYGLLANADSIKSDREDTVA